MGRGPGGSAGRVGGCRSRQLATDGVVRWRQHESAGKRRSTRLKKGAPWLKTALVQAAWAAVRKKHGYFNAQFQRLRGRRGARKAICAVAASMLATIYHMLTDGTAYADLGPDHFRTNEPMTRAKALARQIELASCSLSPAAPSRPRQSPFRRTQSPRS